MNNENRIEIQNSKGKGKMSEIQSINNELINKLNPKYTSYNTKDLFEVLDLINKNITIHFKNYELYQSFHEDQFNDIFNDSNLITILQNEREVYQTIPDEFIRAFRICINVDVNKEDNQKYMKDLSRLFRELLNFLKSEGYLLEFKDIELIGPGIKESIRLNLPMIFKIRKLSIKNAEQNIVMLLEFKRYLKEKNKKYLRAYINKKQLHKVRRNDHDYPADLLLYYPEYFNQMINDIIPTKVSYL